MRRSPGRGRPRHRNMDRLRALIESDLRGERALFNLDQTIFFYDLTSTYFEGQALNNPSAKRGYSRDKRPDCKQVVVGLVINRDGFPQAHEIFDGNTQDRASLPAMLDALRAWGAFAAGRWWSSTAAWRSTRPRAAACELPGGEPRANAPAGRVRDPRGLRRGHSQSPTGKDPVKLKRTEDAFVLCIGHPRQARARLLKTTSSTLVGAGDSPTSSKSARPSAGQGATRAWRATTTSPSMPTHRRYAIRSTNHGVHSPSVSMAATYSNPTAPTSAPRAWRIYQLARRTRSDA